jgi:hypothetical protein
MARSAEEIKRALSLTVATADPTADLAKGPIADLLLFPVAPELAATEQTVEDLRVLASLQLDKVVTETEINAIGTAFGLPPVSGKPARYRQTFYTSSRPTRDIPIERGTLVGTSDASRVYVVTERVVMLASNADAYLNASRKRYEITANVECTSIGTAGNLPAFRIKRFLTRISGIDGTENRETANVLGTDRQSFADYLARIRRKFVGLNPETGSGIATRIVEYAPEDVLDISLVYPKDRAIFRRDTGRPAIDAYILGETQDTTQQRFVATGTESVVVLDTAPVLSISSVLVDGSPYTAYALNSDTNPSTSGTARASDLIVFSTPLTSGQIVEINYAYDSLINGLQTNVFDDDGREFGTDILLRRPELVQVIVHVDVTVLPSFDVNRTTDAVRTIIFDYVETDRFIGSLLPETLQQKILSDVSGVSSVKIQRFTTTSGGTLPVEVVSLNKSQISAVDQNNLLISTHQ